MPDDRNPNLLALRLVRKIVRLGRRAGIAADDIRKDVWAELDVPADGTVEQRSMRTLIERAIDDALDEAI